MCTNCWGSVDGPTPKDVHTLHCRGAGVSGPTPKAYLAVKRETALFCFFKARIEFRPDLFCPAPCEVVQCEKRYRTDNAPWPSSWSSGEAPTANLIAEAAKSMDAFDLVSKERVDTRRPTL